MSFDVNNKNDLKKLYTALKENGYRGSIYDMKNNLDKIRDNGFYEVVDEDLSKIAGGTDIKNSRRIAAGVLSILGLVNSGNFSPAGRASAVGNMNFISNITSNIRNMPKNGKIALFTVAGISAAGLAGIAVGGIGLGVYAITEMISGDDVFFQKFNDKEKETLDKYLKQNDVEASFDQAQDCLEELFEKFNSEINNNSSSYTWNNFKDDFDKAVKKSSYLKSINAKAVATNYSSTPKKKFIWDSARSLLNATEKTYALAKALEKKNTVYAGIRERPLILMDKIYRMLRLKEVNFPSSEDRTDHKRAVKAALLKCSKYSNPSKQSTSTANTTTNSNDNSSSDNSTNTTATPTTAVKSNNTLESTTPNNNDENLNGKNLNNTENNTVPEPHDTILLNELKLITQNQDDVETQLEAPKNEQVSSDPSKDKEVDENLSELPNSHISEEDLNKFVEDTRTNINKFIEIADKLQEDINNKIGKLNESSTEKEFETASNILNGHHTAIKASYERIRLSISRSKYNEVHKSMKSDLENLKLKKTQFDEFINSKYSIVSSFMVKSKNMSEEKRFSSLKLNFESLQNQFKEIHPKVDNNKIQFGRMAIDDKSLQACPEKEVKTLKASLEGNYINVPNKDWLISAVDNAVGTIGDRNTYAKNISSILPTLNSLKRSLEAIDASLKNLSNTVTTESLAKEVNDLINKINEDIEVCNSVLSENEQSTSTMVRNARSVANKSANDQILKLQKDVFEFLENTKKVKLGKDKNNTFPVNITPTDPYHVSISDVINNKSKELNGLSDKGWYTLKEMNALSVGSDKNLTDAITFAKQLEILATRFKMNFKSLYSSKKPSNTISEKFWLDCCIDRGMFSNTFNWCLITNSGEVYVNLSQVYASLYAGVDGNKNPNTKEAQNAYNSLLLLNTAGDRYISDLPKITVK